MGDYRDSRVLIDDQRQLKGDVITICVGDGKESYTIHKNMICRRSKYFRSKIMLEPKRTSFDLAVLGVTEETVHHYLQYLYSGKIPCQSLEDIADPEDSKCRSRLIRFHALTSKLGDSRAMDAAVSSLIASLDEGNLPNHDTIKEIYAATKSGSRLRKFLVDTYVWSGAAEEVSEKACKAFLLDVAKASLAKIAELGEDGWEDNLAAASCCDYHEHPEDKPCLNKKRKRDGEEDEAESGEDEEASESG